MIMLVESLQVVYEMKGDVGMSLHEKGMEQGDA